MKKFVILLCILLIGKAALSEDVKPVNVQDDVPAEIVLTGNLQI